MLAALQTAAGALVRACLLQSVLVVVSDEFADDAGLLGTALVAVLYAAAVAMAVFMPMGRLLQAAVAVALGTFIDNGRMRWVLLVVAAALAANNALLLHRNRQARLRHRSHTMQQMTIARALQMHVHTASPETPAPPVDALTPLAQKLLDTVDSIHGIAAQGRAHPTAGDGDGGGSQSSSDVGGDGAQQGEGQQAEAQQSDAQPGDGQTGAGTTASASAADTRADAQAFLRTMMILTQMEASLGPPQREPEPVLFEMQVALDALGTLMFVLQLAWMAGLMLLLLEDDELAVSLPAVVQPLVLLGMVLDTAMGKIFFVCLNLFAWRKLRPAALWLCGHDPTRDTPPSPDTAMLRRSVVGSVLVSGAVLLFGVLDYDDDGSTDNSIEAQAKRLILHGTIAVGVLMMLVFVAAESLSTLIGCTLVRRAAEMHSGGGGWRAVLAQVRPLLGLLALIALTSGIVWGTYRLELYLAMADAAVSLVEGVSWLVFWAISLCNLPYEQHEQARFHAETGTLALKAVFSAVTIFLSLSRGQGLSSMCAWNGWLLFETLRARWTDIQRRRKSFVDECVANASAEQVAAYDDVCSTCLEAMIYDPAAPSNIKITSCGHQFHRACLHHWLMIQRSCPTCRTDLSNPISQSTPPPYEEEEDEDSSDPWSDVGSQADSQPDSQPDSQADSQADSQPDSASQADQAQS